MSEPDSNTLILGTRKGCLIFERGARGWRFARIGHAGSPIPFACVDRRDGTLYASIDHGHWGQKLSRSNDRGATFEEIATPTFPEGAQIKDRFGAQNDAARIPATVRYLWFLAPGGADRPGRLWLGTEPGGLFRSEDRGDHWDLVKGLWDHPSRLAHWMGGGRDHPGIHSILVDPRNSRRILVGISSAGIFESVDDGASWVPRNKGMFNTYVPEPEHDYVHDPHFVTWCARSPDHLWQQNHFGIFRSTDGAKSWTSVSQEKGPARFGFPIAADPKDPHVAWVVPAESDQNRSAVRHRVCAARTVDGGRTWTELRKGLPQRDAWDVVLRHALDLCGNSLAFGSTTGNVYVSEDRGDTWRVLSRNLPPVYSVRFA